MAMDKEREALVAMVDAAMVEMRNISPPLRRSECERLIKAALTAQQEPVAVSIGSLSLQAELGAALGSALNHYRSKDMQACAASLVQIVGLFRAAPPSGVREGPRKLWLWKNLVDGRPEYWAFDNPYPTYGGGDPMTLGEPCGYAIFKQSTLSPRHADFSEADVIAAIQRAAAKEPR